MLSLRLALLVLLSTAVLSGDVLYKRQEAPRAGTALLETPANSRLQCGIRCAREERCTHWAFDMPTSRCRLYPLLSSDPAPRVTETVYIGQTDVPEGYRQIPSTGKGFRKSTWSIEGGQILQKCQLWGPRVTPAVPESEEEYQYLRSTTPVPGSYWLGIKRIDGVYRDMFGRALQINQTWVGFAGDQSGTLCGRIRRDGLHSEACDTTAWFICQYGMY